MSEPANNQAHVPDRPIKPVDGQVSVAVDQIARSVAEVAGALSLCIAHRFVKRQDVEVWVRKLRMAPSQLEGRFLS